MRAAASVLIVVLAALGTACSSVRTQYDFDPRTDFAAWQTYAWYPSGSLPTGDPRLDNPLLHARIEAAVNRTFVARGYVQVQGRTPDFYVNYHLSTEQRLDVRTMNRVYLGGPHERNWGGAGWGGVGWAETVVDQYEEGTLLIDLIDVAARRLAWRGSGTRRLSRSPQSDQLTQRVNEAVDEILVQFPPNP
jgi:hypothetical protein